jgi:Zn-dependent M28 family amino/carboxypeptidase
MPGRSFNGPLPELSPVEAEIRDRLRRHVETLAGAIGERNLRHPEALDSAVDYIRGELEVTGYQVSEQSYESPGFTIRSGDVKVPGKTVRNVEVSLPGTTSEAGIAVVGAHYDSWLGTPGADDNASGVAGLLELARLLRDTRPKATTRFVFFVNEEPPFFQGDHMGSLVYARRCRERGERVNAMLALEMIGYYTTETKSQDFPFPFSWIYPSRADFIAFIGDYRSRKLLKRTVGLFRESASIPSRGAAAPTRIEGIDWSDHSSFWRAGYPAIMVTDTSFLRYKHYHELTETPDRLDYDRMARVVVGLAGAVRKLALE